MAPFPSLKLTYFDCEGRAEVIRAAFVLGGVPFVDERVTKAQFAGIKASFPHGKLPVLTVDDEQIAESQGLLRYAGRLTGMYPVNDAVAAMLVDEILSAFEGLLEDVIGPSFRETDPVKVKALREEILAGQLPQYLQRIENRLQYISAYPFFQNSRDQIYIHELAAWDCVAMFNSCMLEHIPANVTTPYATMVSMFNRIASHPKIKLWEATQGNVRPKKIKLTYFHFTARAEHIRLAFHIGGVAFEDNRLMHQQFVERKYTLPYGQLPVLEVDGVVIAQSLGLLRYAGTITGLYPTNNPIVAARIDEVLGHVHDLYDAIGPSFVEEDPIKVREMREKLARDTIPQSFATLEKRVALWKNKSQYTMGDAITIADLMIHSIVTVHRNGYFEHVPVSIMDPYVNLLAVHEAVSKHPRVIDWYEQRSRPST